MNLKLAKHETKNDENSKLTRCYLIYVAPVINIRKKIGHALKKIVLKLFMNYFSQLMYSLEPLCFR